MGCSSCSSNNGLPGGCKNNGACGTYGCNKLDVFDWLAGMDLPEGQKPFDIVEVRFKNSRKNFYRNVNNIDLYPGDVVAVEASPGHDIGVVSLVGELVRIQMKRKDAKDNYEVRKVYRKAKQEDIEKWQEARALEQNTMMTARSVARELDLQMKISDVEYQGDKTKATFFYTADDRVDFRELIKRYADTFKVRIEMRQIGYRVEAGRLGGIGSCGRELCCSTWLTDFRAVSTSAARYQQLSLNPTKLAGQCGKLKCCLNYELDQYVEAIKDLPNANVRLKLPKGVAIHFKTDIFKRIMFYVYEDQPGEAPIKLTIEAVKEIQEMNRKGLAVQDIDAFSAEEEVVVETDFAEVVGQDSLTRFDRAKGGKGNNNRGRNNNNRGPRNDRREGSGQNKQRPPRDQKPQGEGVPPNQPRPERKPQEQKPRPPRSGNNAPNRNEGGAPRPEGGAPRPEGTGRPRPNNRRNNRGPRRDGDKPSPPKAD
jgi:cell fate regulator YaaT (PSP1 superfamily)